MTTACSHPGNICDVKSEGTGKFSQRDNGRERERGVEFQQQIFILYAGHAISCMDWDIRGDRLALGFGKDHPDAGKVGLYSTVCQPVISTQLIGKISSGTNDQPIEALKFHTKYHRGALLAVLSSSKQTSIIPLLYNLA